MADYKMLIEYDGTRYDGWMRPDSESVNTVEYKIREVLKKLSGEDVEVKAALRTEKGVHAYGQVASFSMKKLMTELDILHYLNRYLPRDIAVTNVERMTDRFDASLGTYSKTYLYRLDLNEVPDVFERHFKYYCFKKPDFKAMEAAAKVFVGKHDFRKFSGAKRNKNNEKTVYSITFENEGTEAFIRIEANDFLHNMARYMFGCLLEAGNHTIECTDIEKYLKPELEEKPETMADTCGLFLEGVKYKNV